MTDSIDKYVITGRLDEDGQAMDFPVLENGNLRPLFRAVYHVHPKNAKEYGTSKNLVYLALPSETTLEIGEMEVPIPFKQKGEVKDIKRFKLSPYAITTEGWALAKIHPRTPYKLKAKDGTTYHSFEMLETPASYRNPDEMHFDFVLLPESEKGKLDKGNAISEWAMMERGSRVIRMPGVVLFPENCAFRIPGWQAGEFNGSPELRFAYAPFTEPRMGEVLHYHQEIMEPYLGLGGRAPIFIRMEKGSQTFTFKDLEGNKRIHKGEIFEIGKGDVLLPLPNVARTILFDDAQFPYEHYNMNYAARPLNEVPASDRVILENYK